MLKIIHATPEGVDGQLLLLQQRGYKIMQMFTLPTGLDRMSKDSPVNAIVTTKYGILYDDLKPVPAEGTTT